MCVNEVFSEMRPDGRVYTWSEPDLCYRSRHGKLCDRTQELRRPHGYRRTEPRTAYNHGQLPPTPPLSYHSDHTSDSERSSRRRSGVYINEPKVIDVSRRRSLRHDRQGSGDHSLYVDNSPLSRSPLSRSPLSRSPSLYRQRSVSSSPARDVYIEPSSYRETSDRPTSIKVEIINEPPKHRKQGSSSKTSSSRDSNSNNEERRHRRLSSVQHGDQHLQRDKETKIARQNEAIANRAPPQNSSSGTRYRRGSVSITQPLTIEEEMKRRHKKEERARERAHEREVEAQKERLRDRFTYKG
ncbi:hypothetical protein F4777DRAFT_548033 [Nemania sp. FL0916]|nr:hypothetical protein F4777DRAFT_548033 [Nemania sp. FL0916]